MLELTHLAVATVGDELLRELRHPGVQVVEQHVDDGGRLSGPRGNLVDGNGVERKVGHEPVHVDVPELSQLGRELLSQDLVGVGGEVSESVPHGQLLLLPREAVGPEGSMSDVGVSSPGSRERIGLEASEEGVDGG